VELKFQFSAKRLTVRIFDNGCGIDARMLKKGRDGHWVLATMRERAATIGGLLKIVSSATRSTEVQLSIPIKPPGVTPYDLPPKHVPSRLLVRTKNPAFSNRYARERERQADRGESAAGRCGSEDELRDNPALSDELEGPGTRFAGVYVSRMFCQPFRLGAGLWTNGAVLHDLTGRHVMQRDRELLFRSTCSITIKRPELGQHLLLGLRVSP
jgi:hypothetical protein